MSAAAEELRSVRAGGVLRLTLGRPAKGNALSNALVAALAEAVHAAARAGVRLLVIEGAGRHFCTGFDLSALEDETDDTLLARFVRIELLLQALHAAPMPTLAIAHGRTMGAGADLFGACAARWVVGEASFAFPGTGFGLVLGTARLADIVGAARAREWVEGGAPIDTEAALAAGFATRRLAPEDVEAQIEALAARVQRLEPGTHDAIHAAVDGIRRPRGDAGDGLDLLRLAQSAARPGLKARIAAYRAALARS